MNLKKEYLWLLVIIAVLCGYLIWQRQEQTAYRLPELPAVAAEILTRIEIDRAGEPQIHLKRVDDGWRIGPEDYLADQDKVNGIIEAVASVRLTALVSEARSYERYDLDEAHRIRVRAWAGDSLKRDLTIGKSASTYRHTFIAVADDPNVYHAREDFRGRFDRTVDQLRDKRVLSFRKNEIRALSLQTGAAQALRFTLQPPDQPSPETEARPGAAPSLWRNAAGQPADGAIIDEILGSLATLECAAYLYDRAKTDMEKKAPAYTLVLEGEKPLRLILFAPEGDEAQRAGISSENDYPFLLSAFLSRELPQQIDRLSGAPPQEEGKDGDQPPAK
jgi:hypothetical protein